MEMAEWLKPLLTETCPYCSSPIVNNANLTDRYCSNPRCPGHMSFKVSEMATRLGIKGVGPATALSLIEQFQYPYHFCYLPVLIADKPRVYLWQVGEYAMIKGFQKRWQDICHGKHNMMEVCDDPYTPKEVRDSRTMLVACESFFDVMKPLEGARVYVMMTGSFDGYRSRKDFIADMNEKYGDMIQLIDVGKRKTGVDYLIKEPWTSDHEKSAIAAEYHIPVVSPAQMKEIISGAIAYINEGGGQS